MCAGAIAQMLQNVHNIGDMEHISVGGEKYVKASSIARELGYTADYVGQLARSGKIEAQLVGRSWFVNERSIQEHKRDRYRSTAAKSREALKESLESFRPSRERVRAPESHFEKRAIYNSLQYEADPYEVLPTIPERAGVESVSTETEAEESLAEVPSAGMKSEVHAIPIRAIPEPPRSASVRSRAPLQDTPKPTRLVADTEDRLVVVGEQRGTGAVFAGILSLFVALMGFIALIGIEGKVVAENDSMDSGYQFNVASVVEALYNIEK